MYLTNGSQDRQTEFNVRNMVWSGRGVWYVWYVWEAGKSGMTGQSMEGGVAVVGYLFGVLEAGNTDDGTG